MCLIISAARGLCCEGPLELAGHRTFPRIVEGVEMEDPLEYAALRHGWPETIFGCGVETTTAVSLWSWYL